MAKFTSTLAALLLFAATAAAASPAGPVEVQNAWARATPGGAETGAIYLTLEAPNGDRLTGVSSPVAREAGMHEMTRTGNIMKMRQLPAIDLPAGRKVTLRPGGMHIMLLGLKQPLHAGDSIPLTLDFAKAGKRQVTVPVEKIGAMGPAHAGQGGMAMPMHH
jgi:copper(I)-binding protein